MDSYDLFEQRIDGPIWLETHYSLEQARVRMHKLTLVRGMHLRLYSALHGRFIEEMRPIS